MVVSLCAYIDTEAKNIPFQKEQKKTNNNGMNSLSCGGRDGGVR
jgi:hypothetical protein